MLSKVKRLIQLIKSYEERFNKIDLTSDDIKILIGIFKALKKRGK